ncbi:MAG: glycosyltransferase [Lysobacter sp.]
MISTASSSGLLVLGMHRSGTSALTRVINLCGADIGTRILGESVGNEVGHWEDALAVELHERLFASFGTSWSDAFGLPADWASGEDAAEARKAIQGYIQGNRARHGLWAVKDPRLCLFSRLWVEGAANAGQSLGAILVLRHPLEVANSLMARDGIPLGRGLLLWLEYTESALQIAKDLPCVLITYNDLLNDWQACIERIRHLPGGGHLQVDDVIVRSVEEFLDCSRRHHKELDVAPLPHVVSETWIELSKLALEGRLSARTADGLADKVSSIRALVHPLLSEQRVVVRQLWQRVSRAEIELPAEIKRRELIAESVLKSVEGQHAALTSLASVLSQQHGQVINAISTDIRDMQSMVSASLERAAKSEGKAEVAERLASRFDQLDISRAALEADVEQIKLAAQTVVAAAEGRAERATVLLDQERNRIAKMQREIESDATARAELIVNIQGLQGKNEEVRAELVDACNLAETLADELEHARIGLEDAVRELEEQAQELTALRYETVQLRHVSAQNRVLVDSWSWRVTRPLRVARRLLTGRWAASDTEQVRNILRKALSLVVGSRVRSRVKGENLINSSGRIEMSSDSVSAAADGLASVPPDLPDVFVWSVIDFHFRVQRPQHLARALAAKGHRVFYISVNFWDIDKEGFHLDPLDGCGRLYQVHLYLAGEPLIYSRMATPKQVKALHASLAELLAWTHTRSSISLVQHPYWIPLIRSIPNARVVYDCMDHHAGFDNNSPAVLNAERELIENSELVIVTSDWLKKEVEDAARETAVIRNASEFEFFKNPPSQVFQDSSGRKIIGYYGAIASWFDVELLQNVAQAHPDALVVLVGHDSTGIAAALADIRNVLLVGEVPYARLPYWLHSFDVCLLPFKIIPLTLATNPVKVYEYLAAGKSVVAVDLPEMAQFDGLIRTAVNSDAFIAAVSASLAVPASAELVANRQAFASRQTWAHRAAELDAVLDDLKEPCISVVVLTYNNLAFTKACLKSIEVHSDYRNLEVIVVDNASSDGTVDFLAEWEAENSAGGHARRVILNQDNLGFAAGNNVGLAAATGDVLLMLNNDTFVTPGWVRTLHSHLKRNVQLGLVGPVTNNIGNEARIDISYVDMAQMVEQAGYYTRMHAGLAIPMQTLAFFCVMMPRAVYDSVGGLDEAFGLGFFEDDDYCRRVQQAGWQIECAEDVFVHHELSASFNQVGADKKKELFDRNKAMYESKWGLWKAHAYRQTLKTGQR